ncbi:MULTISPECIES: hypothetical protein [Ralstonia]|uniref:hypothetical protein n=1 Tax=Ralstonia TaxID=48736 RepID=UPI001E52DB82|nr:hypothetical protein [Ralstonia wenshanensis]MCT7309126.1 hypothetical protein [Ralstonia wenshanensis]UGS92733.1 hypothetical protein KOL96_12590 [Ralstonia wenshanensis]
MLEDAVDFEQNLLTSEVSARYNPAFRGLAAQCRKPGAQAQGVGRLQGGQSGSRTNSNAYSRFDSWIFVHSIFSRSFARVSQQAARSI